METRTLDLSQQRCPMSLLLAKRAAQSLDINGKLEIKVVDKTSLADIMKYFELNAFAINVEYEASFVFLTVTRK
ncbi:sulfurtransferase TusA family protein [Aliivibrio sp. S4TY2]|uniref:sulfurtransferase TusA family protein n=1 Tax=unclassified Aliivibrio TaxID=2645654 RepID=UPI0023797E34|nr:MULTISPECIES: sulfurtransferase TusA family protein [unclassified Aliivibrio]MDD9154850.1 sulfurtransferase TusA family protein [Aliivibrio sp. S4TY2]MDD9158787.1 sulfurtransferase TusA family protein [Aliivibrio sp. S4TY1]MDD9162853.1 sulfurtransferase TusA family protein [Aliivibrio sp. S4MY2]MDD9166786.1 sulfurtransferase TusA family protein [Aliivibrio sp. S4MY4]MDD9183930.1 sulfurtransferase TusA family protein [Aliivibrio sp. S4MY3]